MEVQVSWTVPRLVPRGSGPVPAVSMGACHFSLKCIGVDLDGSILGGIRSIRGGTSYRP